MSEEKNNDRFLLGIIIGSSISTVVSLLFHPQTGAKTRQIIVKTSEAIPELIKDFSTTLKIHRHDLWDFSSKKLQNTIRRVQVAIDAGIEASKMEAQAQKEREINNIKQESTNNKEKVEIEK